MSDNKLTGTSLEVLSFMSSGIKKRTGSEYSDGRPGRINYHSEDEYRTVTLTLQATAEDMHDIAHLRDAVNELFDDELTLREMRIKSVEVEYESMGQHTGELQLESPEYVNGKQIKVAMVNSPEIDDTTLVSTITVEFETTESPYFETIYTTLELHDSGYSTTAEKYGLVDNIDDEKVKYRFTPGEDEIIFNSSSFQKGSIHNSGGYDLDAATEYARTVGFLSVNKNSRYRIVLEETSGNANFVRLFHYSEDGSFISNDNGMTIVSGNGKSEYNFTALGEKLRLVIYPVSGKAISLSDIGSSTKISMYTPSTSNSFSVYNAGNVTIEPESMSLNIYIKNLITGGNFTIRNKTTGDTFIMERSSDNFELKIKGMVVGLGGISNIFRNTNRRFIKLVPGDNQFEILNGTFEEMRFEFKYLYK